MPEHTFLTIKEVARRYQVHPETIRRWILQGRMPALRIAGSPSWRIRETDLERIETQAS